MKSFKPNEKIKNNAYVGSVEKYNEIYDYSIKDPEGFWAEQAERITSVSYTHLTLPTKRIV